MLKLRCVASTNNIIKYIDTFFYHDLFDARIEIKRELTVTYYSDIDLPRLVTRSIIITTMLPDRK